MKSPSVNQFLTLSPENLRSFAEQCLNVERIDVPQIFADQILAEWTNLTPLQKVYAVEIAMRLAPEKHLCIAIDCLSSSDAELCCAACNAIVQYGPKELPVCIADQLIAIKPVLLNSNHIATGEPVTLGTNMKFVRSVREKYRV